MGIGSTELYVMLKMKQQGFIPDRCAVAEIGAQQLNDTFLAAREALDRMGELFSAEGPSPLPSEVSIGTKQNLLAGAPLSRPFWKWLGLNYTAIDVDGSPDAVPLDLNFDNAPGNLKGRFHYVSNMGTTEHIINQMQAFKVIHDLTAVDGIMMHVLPSQGLVNHGFFLYHPNFFFTMSRTNGYKVVYASVSKGRHIPYPEGTIELMSRFDPSIAKRHDGYAPMDSGLTVCMQKQYDTAFVPPLDVRPGSETDNPVLAERYWSVFKPDPFADLRAERAKAGQESAKDSNGRPQTADERELEIARRERAVEEREKKLGMVST
jgi:hypothetical protein